MNDKSVLRIGEMQGIRLCQERTNFELIPIAIMLWGRGGKPQYADPNGKEIKFVALGTTELDIRVWGEGFDATPFFLWREAMRNKGGSVYE